MKKFLFTLIILIACLVEAKECVRNQNELSQTRRLYDYFEKVGGLSVLQGKWYFAGFLGIGKTKIEFVSSGIDLQARVNNSDLVQMTLCEADSVENTIEVLVHADETFSVLVKITDKNHLQVAAEKSNWSFYNFARLEDVQSTPILAQNDLITKN